MNFLCDFNISSLCSCFDSFESDLVRANKDKFSLYEANITKLSSLLYQNHSPNINVIKTEINSFDCKWPIYRNGFLWANDS